MSGELVEAADAHDRCCWVSGGQRCTAKPSMESNRLSACVEHHHKVRLAKMAPGDEEDDRMMHPESYSETS